MGLLKTILLGRSAKIVLWVILWLALADVAVNVAFGSRSARQTTLGRYFEYGRSVEGKLAEALKEERKKGSLLSAGWIDPELLKSVSWDRNEGTDLTVAVYGQSFSMQATNAAVALDGKITLRGFGGPGAPPNHSYAGYTADTPFRKADVVVFGVLSASVPDMGSISGLLWQFESPAPFTFPRYRLAGTQLTEVTPLIRSENQFRQAFGKEEWRQFKQQLATSDRGYDWFVFDQSPLDRSAIVRLVRRGWVAHHESYDQGVYDSHKGFNTESDEVRVLKEMLVDLQRRTQQRGERLIVLLLHTRGQSDHLAQAIEPTLKAAKIDYISTHTLFSANDPTNFLPDGHYVPTTNQKLATVLASKLRGRNTDR
ncbi:hypothetical protein [Piscinibacter gummiphilus]|uniref:Uncharacterized protein n=1 Tax=Piscinibacter gummiphilus TaxID=946333 RepID=A0ABZ0CWS3_9BURK|nr:hypothetical protein [Piscinibacter gummiphilus]WOB07318.1 hypothetical protein RXV79_20660 [Piscinibacter gummiphilus]